MKLSELVSVFLKENKPFSRKQGQNFIVYVHVPCYHARCSAHMQILSLFSFGCVVCKWVTEHVTMLKRNI